MKAILFVDDHEILARLSCEILETQGYRAECAFSGNEALQKFAREKYDILITDYRMDDMNGLELAKRIRLQAPEIPIVVVSGYPVEGNDEVDAWLEKQSMFPALLDKIKLLLGERDSEPALNAL